MTAIQCISRDTLKQYLAGWIEESQMTEIEQHLESCEACEQTVTELESKPDTIVAPLQRMERTSSASGEPDPAFEAALAKAEQLMKPVVMTVPIEHSAPVRNVGPYELIRKLGGGGMGAVFLAKHNKLGKHVAVKLLPASWGADDEAVARFRREIVAAGKLNHDSIVSATDAGEQDGVHYLVMEYVDGIDLSQLTRISGPLPIADACELMRQTALGLSYAHAGGIVHRDVKPSNVMLNDRGQVKVLDFGLAQLNPWDEAAAELTSVGQLMGTLDYMAPEQAECPNAVDYRADLYALGATLFRLLAGRAPLAAAPNLSPLHKLRLLAQHAPPRLDTIRHDAPPELVQLVAALLARDPEGRPASAAHVAEQLAPMCVGANLVALAARTREAASQSAESAGDGNRFPWSQTKRPWAHSKSSHRPHRRLATLVAIGLLAIFLWGAVTIALETRKGLLVIESEVPDVHIKLLTDGKIKDELQIDTGTTSTRLAADKYVIMLDAPSDSVVIDKQDFVLKRGDTVIARVRYRHAVPGIANLPGGESPIPLPRTSTEPIYDGKTLSEWLTQFSRERSPKAVGESLMAIDALVQKDTAEQITQSLVAQLPSIDGNISFSIGENLKSYVDASAFKILAKANPGKLYFELLAKLLKDADTEWGKRILTGVHQRTNPTEEELEPLFQWFESIVSSNSKSSSANRDLIEPGAWMIRTFLYARSDLKYDPKKIEQRFIPLFEKSEQLGESFWLKVPPDANWTDGIKLAVIRHAVQILKDPAASPRFVAQAAMILKSVNLKPDIELPELATAIRNRLSAILIDPQRMWQLTEVESSFSEMISPEAPPGISLSVQDYKTSEIIKLLDLVPLLKTQGETQFDLDPIVTMTSESYIKVARIVDPQSGARRPRTTFSWPRMTVARVVSGFQMMDAFSRGNAPFTQSEWLGFFICYQACQIGEIPLPMAQDNDHEQAQSEIDSKTMAYFQGFVKKADKNGDGVLTPDEWSSMSKDPSAADKDRDGKITPTEYAHWSLSK